MSKAQDGITKRYPCRGDGSELWCRHGYKNRALDAHMDTFNFYVYLTFECQNSTDTLD